MSAITVVWREDTRQGGASDESTPSGAGRPAGTKDCPGARGERGRAWRHEEESCTGNLSGVGVVRERFGAAGARGGGPGLGQRDWWGRPVAAWEPGSGGWIWCQRRGQPLSILSGETAYLSMGPVRELL